MGEVFFSFGENIDVPEWQKSGSDFAFVPIIQESIVTDHIESVQKH